MNHFQRYLIEEFAEDYSEGTLSRRDALKLIAGVTGSVLLASSILAACAPQEFETAAQMATSTLAPQKPTVIPSSTSGSPAQTESAVESSPTTEPPEAETQAADAGPSAYGTVSPDDPTVQAADISIPAEGAELIGYLAQPAAASDPRPVILVCHENRGLTDHIKDVTRRLAKAGYVGLAVDLLSRSGGTGELNRDDVPGVLGNTPPEQFVADFLSAWEYSKTLPGADAERVGMVGFCFGGGVTWLMATAMPELKAAVPFYGPNPPLEDIPNIQAAVLAIYGEQDQRINAGIPEVEAAMKENGKTFEKLIYPNAGHAFHNDTGERYVPEAAQDAWGQTLSWFEKYV